VLGKPRNIEDVVASGLQVARPGNAFGCHVFALESHELWTDDVAIEQVELDELRLAQTNQEEWRKAADRWGISEGTSRQNE